jgi:hypothetical protein
MSRRHDKWYLFPGQLLGSVGLIDQDISRRGRGRPACSEGSRVLHRFPQFLDQFGAEVSMIGPDIKKII